MTAREVRRAAMAAAAVALLWAALPGTGAQAEDDRAPQEAPAGVAENAAPSGNGADGNGAEGDAAEGADAGKAEEAGPLLQLTEEGVAGIGAETPFDPMAVRQQLPPGFAVTAGTYRGEGEPLRNINVLRNDAPVLSLYPGPDEKISLIQVLSPAVGVGAGAVGSRFEAFFPEGPAADCFRGMERLSGMVICTHPDSRRVNLLFENAGWEGPDDVVPPPEALAGWPLKYVIWSAAPRPESDGRD